MSLSRSPSPSPRGGWSSPGLTTPYENRSRQASPIRFANGSAGNVTWASAQARSAEVRSYPSLSSRNAGFIRRNFRKLSISLPSFRSSKGYADREKLGRGRSFFRQGGALDQSIRFLGRLMWRMRSRFAIVIGFLLLILLFYVTPLHQVYRRSLHFGGGKKFVILQASNEGGGVMEWKGGREWAIERDSVRNKRNYARKWGYELELVDMTTRKRYAHEWRESWEKADAIRDAMKKYPDAEWFWWLDLHTFIMEPSYSLQTHIFNNLKENTYRDINEYNPLKIFHPPNDTYLDPESRSPDGDGDPNSINLILSQDCSGFNLGSFFVRRSAWADRLLDIWWDPVGYEQKHMEWEHKEQDALENLYTNQPWIRPHTAFLPQRKINSFPPGACGQNGLDPKIHYVESDRDFLVNMAGCEWGRDCWGEIYKYRQLSNKLNRNPWEKFKDWIGDSFRRLTQRPKDDKKKKKSGK